MNFIIILMCLRNLATCVGATIFGKSRLNARGRVLSSGGSDGVWLCVGAVLVILDVGKEENLFV